MKRETIILLEDVSSVSTSLQQVFKDHYHITKIRMAYPVHSHSVRQMQFGCREDDPPMKEMFKYYDPIPERDLQHEEQCGTMLGNPVFLDNTLKARCLVIESEPIPADKLYIGAYREVS